MTTFLRSPRLLLVGSLLLAVAGIAVLGMPHGKHPPAPWLASPARTTTAGSSVTTSPAVGRPPVGTASSVAPLASTPPAGQSALPPHGEGVAGDHALQRNLEAAWPADLPADDEQTLLAGGRALLRADATGVGRAQWPEVFGNSGQAVSPAFAAARFRIQAAIARRDTSPDKAVVHLVWAGMDRGGTFTDLRITDWFFTRAHKNGAATWIPQPRT
ncbi:hypothetical protein [Streptomyces sp. CdTB01]|uniref:hypothetical protein n=1 Tax=Streptomyces sp. CdTB01 TaxID=1725411 RepID=UPI00073AA67E|nr:hypothetical protein [Streptomyces sp. CdTB01]ALV30733.1 hypothetical protein AS200_00425 [Streptomyces sp. CdTB01]